MAAKILANLIVWALLYIGKGFCSNISSGIVHFISILGQLGCSVCYFLPPCTSCTLCTYSILMADASKNGVAQEAVQNIKRASKTMTEAEARQILGVTEDSSWEEIVQKYDNLFERNAKSGSFYLQSKVHRAKECLEEVYKPKEPETK